MYTQTGVKPVPRKSVLRSSSPGFAENPRGKAASPAAPANAKVNGYQGSPAGNPTIKVAPDAEAFKGGEILVNEEEQNLAVTPESITSSSMESDETLSSEEDCYSSASMDSSSLPSPEIFRRESYGVCVCVSILVFPHPEYKVILVCFSFNFFSSQWKH